MLATLVGVFVLAAVVSGCGSGGDSAPTKAEFVKEANAICKRGKEEALKSFSALAKRPDYKAPATVQDGMAEIGEKVMIPFFSSQVEELGELTPPSGNEDEVEAILVALEKGVEEGRKKPELLLDSTPSIVKSSKLAEEYGLEQCDRY